MTFLENYAKLVALVAVGMAFLGLAALSLKVHLFKSNIINHQLSKKNSGFLWVAGLLIAAWWMRSQEAKRRQYVLARKQYRKLYPLLSKSEIDGDHLISVDDIKGRPVYVLKE